MLKNFQMAVVVAQLAKRSLPTPEVPGSNPIISKIYIDKWITLKLIRNVNCIETKKI